MANAPLSGESHIDADFLRCRDIIREGSRSFYAASFLLPKDIRQAAYALYAFCRYSDDVIDIHGGNKQAVDDLSARLKRIYDGDPFPAATDRAFAQVVEQYSIPSTLPFALLEGLAWDVQGRRYNTIDDLYDYAARVASSVGAMMSVLMGARGKDAIARACDLGVAMQLTNIARDVGEDAREGRIYLPLEWLEEAGVDVEQWLAAPKATDAIAGATRRLLETADQYYERGLTGVEFLPANCRAGIVAAADIYADIGRQIAANDYDSVTRRAFISTRRKLLLLLNALAAPNFSYMSPAGAPLEANAFLVDAVESVGRESVELDDEGDAIGQVLDLFMRLENRDRSKPFGVGA
ncbi:MAG: phytoene/squalene synthase family protein [Pseudomonadota bacterium]